MHRKNSPAAHLVLWALVAPAVALADLPKVVLLPYVAGDGVTEQQAKKFTQQLESQLKARTDLTLVTPPSASPKAKAEAAAARSPRASNEGSATIEEGKKSFVDLKFDDAYEKLKKGIELTVQDPAGIDWPKLLEAQLALAVSAFRLGEERDAANALLTLARWNPGADVSAYPPVFQREFEKAKKKLDKQGRQTLTLDGPPGSTAFIDGRDLGMVPVEESVAAGTHYVKVESGGQKWGQAVEVKGAPVKVKGVLAGSPEKPSAPATEPRLSANLDARAAEKLAAWCGATGADFALVGALWRISDTELSVSSAVYWTRKEGFSLLGVYTFAEGSTGAPEAGKVLDKLAAKVEMFGATLPLPHLLIPKGAARSGDEVITVAERPTPRAQPRADQPVAEPKPSDAAKPKLVPQGGDDSQIPIDEPPPEVKTEMSTAAKVVLIAAGVAVAAGIGVGTYFIVSSATKPVTGTVTATW